MAGHASFTSAPPRRSLNELFFTLPTETQQDVLSHLDSRPHLLALSLSSRHLYSLCSERLHQEVSFDCLTSESAIISYNEHTAPRHGRVCKRLKLAFSLGPLISRKSDQHRASLFSKVLQYTKHSLTHLEINTAGSDLRDVEDTLQTIIHGGFRQLRSLTLKICDLQEHEIYTLSTFFYHLSRSSHLLPSLQYLSLDGYWELMTSEYNSTATLASNIRSTLQNLQSLRCVRLAYLTVSAQDLKELLSSATHLIKLSLDEIEGLTLDQVLEILSDTTHRTSLEELDITINATSVLSTQGKAGPTNVVLEGLTKLSLGVTQYYSITEDPGAATRQLYTSLFQPRGGAKVSFPSLSVLDVKDAFSHDLKTSATIAKAIAEATASIVSPSLRHVKASVEKSSDVSGLAEIILQEKGIRLHKPFSASTVSPARVIYYNRNAARTREQTIEEQEEAAAALEELIKWSIESSGQRPRII